MLTIADAILTLMMFGSLLMARNPLASTAKNCLSHDTRYGEDRLEPASMLAIGLGWDF